MSDGIFKDAIEGISSINDSFKESFETLKRFLLNIELGTLSITFIILFLLFLVMVLAVLSSPAFFYTLWEKQKGAIMKFMKGDKSKRNWIGKS